MAVAIIKKGPTCKFCKHARSDDVNAVLDRWQRHEQVDGKKMTMEMAFDAIRRLGVENPTRENWLAHRKHIEFVNPDYNAQRALMPQANDPDWVEAQQRILERQKDKTGDVADRLVETQLLIFEEWTNIQLSKGLVKPGTLDQVRGLVSEKTKRKSSDAQDEILKALGGGIGMVFEKALSGGVGDQRASLPAGELAAADEDVVEGEVVDDDTAGADS